MFLTIKKTTLIFGLASMAINLSGCQNIQMAESHIPVTADFKPMIASHLMTPSNDQPVVVKNNK